MAEAKPMNADGGDEGKRPPKRKRLEACSYSLIPEEKQAKIGGFRDEIDSLVKFCRSENRGVSLEKIENPAAALNGVVACLMEESDLPLSKLVDDIFEKVKGMDGNGIGGGFSKASVKSAVLINGQRLCYGVVSADADVLEDDAESALWYWEVYTEVMLINLVMLYCFG